MTIEYTYPKPEPPKPISARVRVRTGPYSIAFASNRDYVHLGFENVHKESIPEVCEAMMTLAGHEWPAMSKELSADVLAERIIARLEGYIQSPSPIDTFSDGRATGWRSAIAIVREECGL